MFIPAETAIPPFSETATPAETHILRLSGSRRGRCIRTNSNYPVSPENPDVRRRPKNRKLRHLPGETRGIPRPTFSVPLRRTFRHNPSNGFRRTGAAWNRTSLGAGSLRGTGSRRGTGGTGSRRGTGSTGSRRGTGSTRSTGSTRGTGGTSTSARRRAAHLLLQRRHILFSELLLTERALLEDGVADDGQHFVAVRALDFHTTACRSKAHVNSFFLRSPRMQGQGK